MKQKAIIVDIDGTLALMNGRGPFEWSMVGTDLPNLPIMDIIEKYLHYNERMAIYVVPKVKILLVTGRETSCMNATVEWMDKYGIAFDALYMRSVGDRRPDFELKKQVYLEEIKDNFDVLFVLEDRDQVVKMWRSIGLTCLQVAEGNF